jgi:3-carboxy-cis,cis-muconate cycloisomerase
MSDAFTPRARLQAMLDVEAALSEAEAALGIVPAAAARAIRAAASADLYDPDAITAAARQAGNQVIPLVKRLTARVESQDADAARYVHWGATSQDIIDTALALQLRASIPAIADALERAAAAAAEHARRHADTPMAGRTWLQQATPTTFGLKAVGWMDSLTRVQAELRRALESALVLQFGGASGTLAALGDRGPALARALGDRLGLRVPTLPWHAHRDRVAALACALGVTAGTLGKIGRDLVLLAQTEVGEAYDPETDAGGSSTMPQKRNPVRAVAAVAAAIRAPGLVATMLSAMPQEHERAAGGWQAEWETLPELVPIVGESAAAIADVLEQLVVDPVRMRDNLEMTRGLVMAEAIVMRLAGHLGKPAAHAIVEAAGRRAAAEGRRLADILAEDAAVTAVLAKDEIAGILAAEHYLGAARIFVANALAERQPGSSRDR